MHNNIITSGILYMGNKNRLIRKGLTHLFPKNINHFIDTFAGSVSVSMNTKAKQYTINDIDKTLHIYYKLFIKNDSKIIEHIENRVKEFGLPTKTTIRCFSDKDEVELYKKAYHSFRDFYNKNKNPLDLYTLMFFAFSQQFRTNKNGDFNMPFGNNCFSIKNKKAIINTCEFFSKNNIILQQKDFQDLFSNIKIYQNDFIYLDPPYSITTATYNEQCKWDSNDDSRLFTLCEEFNKNNIKFGMSNVFINKGIKNKNLIDFCLKNNFKVYTPNNFKYHACAKENNNQQEVYICNYEISNIDHDFKNVNLQEYIYE